MSDNYLPFEIQAEIMKKLPVKSLIQFRSVSKSWKHLIDTSKFIGDYSSQHTQMQHLLVTHDCSFYRDLNYLIVADDDTFPQHKILIPLPLQNMLLLRLLGCSHGLISWFGMDLGASTYKVVVWNPFIRKTVAVAVDISYYGKDWLYIPVLGFGVCRETRDTKLVKIRYIRNKYDIESIDRIPSQVEVFTLSGGAWRTSYGNLPRKSIRFRTRQVVTDGILYLLAVDRDSKGEFNLIISFDLTSEEFKEVNLPHSLAYEHPAYLSMSKRRESLVVIQRTREDNEEVSVVWMMEDGVPESFTKLFTINTGTPRGTIMGFRKSGEPIIRVHENVCKTVVYKACSRHFDDLSIDGIGYPVTFYPYVETLLLHDQPNLKTFCLGNPSVSSAFTRLLLH